MTPYHRQPGLPAHFPHCFRQSAADRDDAVFDFIDRHLFSHSLSVHNTDAAVEDIAAFRGISAILTLGVSWLPIIVLIQLLSTLVFAVRLLFRLDQLRNDRLELHPVTGFRTVRIGRRRSRA